MEPPVGEDSVRQLIQSAVATDIKYDFEMFDGLPGEPYRQWRMALLNFCSTRSDKSGSSWADHLMDINMDGAGQGAPGMPAGQQGVEMVRLRLTRSKKERTLTGQ